MSTIILDLEGVLIDASARKARFNEGKMTPDEYENGIGCDTDVALNDCVEYVRLLHQDHTIIYLTGRRCTALHATQDSLRDLGFPSTDNLIMKAGKGEPTHIFKHRWLRALSEGGEILAFVDDGPSNRQVARELDIPTYESMTDLLSEMNPNS